MNEYQYKRFIDAMTSESNHFFGDREIIASAMQDDGAPPKSYGVIAAAIVYKQHPDDDVILDYG